MKTLTDLYSDPAHFMITAHRGASFEFPENTALSMRKAVEAGADMIEFDLRGTADGIPVLLHDETLRRTSNGDGLPEEYPLSELKKLNFSFWLQMARRETPVYEKMEIPTFEEILADLKNKVFMNIQLTRPAAPFLKTICALFRQYDMYETAYFVTDDYEDSLRVRAIDSGIETCPRNRKIKMDLAELEHQKRFGTRIIQPVAAPEQLDVEQKFFPGADPQLLVDVCVMPADRVDADTGLIRYLADPFAVGIIFQDSMLRGSQAGCPLGKGSKKLLNIGRELRPARSLQFCSYEIEQLVDFRHTGALPAQNPLVPDQFQALGNRLGKRAGKTGGKEQQDC